MLQSNIEFINPNLPAKKVTTVAIKHNEIQTINALYKIGIKVITINDNINLLGNPVSAHADINLFHFDKNTIFCNRNSISSKLLLIKIKEIDGGFSKEYPGDVLLNAVRIGDKLICNTNTIHKSILNYSEKSNLKIIHTNQGYTKCSICIVNENCIITDDESIYKSTQNYFNDVILISKKSIRLEGMNYGFIGGCTGKIDYNKLAFNGRIESHKDHNIIIDTLNKYSIEPIELTNTVLTDIGSIIPLMQEK